MTNLTELWKKGELPEGWYYVKGNRAEGIYAYTAEYLNNMYRPKNSERIIEQVPSYDEWDKLNNACHELEKETACLAVDIVNLKELLKEVNDYLPEFEIPMNILAKIDEVLK